MAVTVDIQSMTVDERLELIDQLWDSIDADQGQLPPVQLTSAQHVELERRLAVMDHEPLYSWDEVRAELIGRLG